MTASGSKVAISDGRRPVSDVEWAKVAGFDAHVAKTEIGPAAQGRGGAFVSGRASINLASLRSPERGNEEEPMLSAQHQQSGAAFRRRQCMRRRQPAARLPIDQRE